ncbi:MAG: response regulator, partial [candidate division KSB1 bacterium]|nr:response regulator [candidate division KSB1 bacterium]
MENNDDYRRVLSEVIGNAGDMVCSPAFANCEDALTALQEESSLQMILMDINLSVMSDIECVRCICKFHRGKRL